MNKHTVASITLVALAMIGWAAGASVQYQHSQHEERMACIAEHGVFTDTGCAWSSR